MTSVPLPGCTSSWRVTVPGEPDAAALAAALPDLLSAAEKQGVSSVPREACGELAMPERTTFLLLGLIAIEAQPADGAPVAHVVTG
jgi:hypothetical protein